MKEKIKVAIIITSLNIGGAENMVTQLVGAISDKYDIHLIVLSSKYNNHLEEDIEKKKIKTTYLNISGKVKLKNYLKLKSVLDEFKPDILHVHLDTLYSLIWAITNNVKLIFTIHSQPYRIYNFKNKYIFHILKLMKKIKFVGVTETITKEAIQIFKINKSDIVTIYNPVDIERFECKRSFNNIDSTIFINIARFHKIKNHELLIKSFKRVLNQIPNSKLLLLGDGDLRDDMIELVKSLNIQQSVIFLGNIPNTEEYLSKADVFVLSSNSEALPITVLEAMASGLPIISTNVGGLSDIINKNGKLVNKKDCIALSEAMIELAKDLDKRRMMSDKSRDIISKYDIKKISNLYEDIYLKELQNFNG